MKPITIRERFRDLIPSLAPEELEQLEANIKADGCRDPLVVWPDGGELVVIDGHNRHEICTRNGIPFNVVEHEFDDEDAASDWIDQNQLGRRNLTPKQMSNIRGRVYERTKKAHGGHLPKEEGRDHFDPFLKTADKLAKQFGVSAPTIKRDGQFAAAVEKIGLADLINKGEAIPSKALVIEIAAGLPENPTEVEIEEAKREAMEPALADAAKKLYGFATRYAKQAIARLRKIPSDDPRRVEALKTVKQYINKELGK